MAPLALAPAVVPVRVLPRAAAAVADEVIYLGVKRAYAAGDAAPPARAPADPPTARRAPRDEIAFLADPEAEMAAHVAAARPLDGSELRAGLNAPAEIVRRLERDVQLLDELSGAPHWGRTRRVVAACATLAPPGHYRYVRRRMGVREGPPRDSAADPPPLPLPKPPLLGSGVLGALRRARIWSSAHLPAIGGALVVGIIVASTVALCVILPPVGIAMAITVVAVGVAGARSAA